MHMDGRVVAGEDGEAGIPEAVNRAIHEVNYSEVTSLCLSARKADCLAKGQ